MFKILAGPEIFTDSVTAASFNMLSNLFASEPFTYFSVTAKVCGPAGLIGGINTGPAIDRRFGDAVADTTLLLSSIFLC